MLIDAGNPIREDMTIIVDGDKIVSIDKSNIGKTPFLDDDIIVEIQLSLTQAILGDKVEIPTLSGFAQLKIPPGIQSGQVLRMRGKGLQNLRGSSRGDMLVKVQLITPNKISNEEKILYEKLKFNEKNKKIILNKIKL